MRKNSTPVRLRDHCWSYICELRTLTSSKNVWLEGRTPSEKVHGYFQSLCYMVGITGSDITIQVHQKKAIMVAG